MTSNSRGELLGKRRVLFSVEGVGGGGCVGDVQFSHKN